MTAPDADYPLMPLLGKATDEQMTAGVARIMAAWNEATDEQVARGRQWYPVAHDLAIMLGDGDAIVGAGVLAALSPMSSWPENIRLARRCVSGDIGGHTNDAIGKVRAILAGADPGAILPDGSKTWNFYRCIVGPADDGPVVVDRHAHDIMAGRKYGQRERGLDARGRYAMVATCYRRAADRLGEIPSVVQAVTWCVQVDATQWQRTR